jgi:flagellar biosynthetic protein FliR
VRSAASAPDTFPPSFLVLARVTPLFLVAPMFSSNMLIPQVRAVLGVALALGLTTVAGHGQAVPSSVMPVIGLMLVNFVVGLALAFAVCCVFAAIQGAGTLGDALSGFSFGSQVDPVNGNPGGAITSFYGMIGIALFLAIGGDAWTLRGLAATFHAVPLTSPLTGAMVHGITGGAVSVVAVTFVGAVEVIAPVMLAVVITDIAFGLVSRVVPQLNVFAVGFPVKVGVSLLVIGVSLPFIAGWLSNQLQASLTTVLQTI